jgi:hypothetical protein
MALQQATTPAIETTTAAQMMIRRRQLAGIVDLVIESI